MTIVKDSRKDNKYIVSYVVDSFPVAPDKPVKKKVVLSVSVVKEGNEFKISAVNSQ
jgi:hypothetical protein